MKNKMTVSGGDDDVWDQTLIKELLFFNRKYILFKV